MWAYARCLTDHAQRAPPEAPGRLQESLTFEPPGKRRNELRRQRKARRAGRAGTSESCDLNRPSAPRGDGLLQRFG
jgi:hypothetical protein